MRGVKCVGDIEKFLEISQPSISQHLSLLRNQGVIDFYIDGRPRCYFRVELANPATYYKEVVIQADMNLTFQE